MISVKWLDTQRAHLRLFLPPTGRPSPQGWDLKILQLLLEMGVQIWKGRNEVIYGRTLEEKRQQAKEAVLCRVQAVYSSPPELLRWFPHPRDVPIEIRHRKGTRTLTTWLRMVNQQAAIMAQETQRDRKRYGTIIRYLTRPRIFDPG